MTPSALRQRGRPAPAETASFGLLPSPLEAVPDLRAAAQWTIAAFGAVGAALIGGGPLVAAGRVHGVGDALTAGISLIVALTGVSIAIWKTSVALEPPITTPATLSDPAVQGLRTMVDTSPADFFGSLATSVDDLLSHRTIAHNIERRLRTETERETKQILEAALLRACDNIDRTAPYVRWLLTMAHVWQIRTALRESRRWCLVAMALIGVGTVGFLTITGHART